MDIITVRVVLAVLVVIITTIIGFRFSSNKTLFTAFPFAIVATTLFFLLGYGITASMNASLFGFTALILAPLVNGAVFTAVFMAISNKNPPSAEKISSPIGIRSLSPDNQRGQELTLGKKPYTPSQLIVAYPSILVLLELILLFLFLFEGSVCILMTLPFFWGLTVFGSLITYHILKNKLHNYRMVFINLALVSSLLPVGQSVENQYFTDPFYSKVTTNIVIDAPITTVFPYVSQFPEITSNKLESIGDVLFAIGLPEPKYAKLACKDKTCRTKIRHCVFTQNTRFVEPVTVYKPPHELTFSVSSKVGHQDKLTGVDIHIRPGGHYFDNHKGQFLLKALSSNRTLIQGTTWYRLNTPLTWYAKPWTEFILHTIHLKVLRHIESLAEQKMG